MGVVEDVLIVTVVEQVGEHVVEENDALAPVGSPEAEKATDCVVPETSAALMELETEAPWLTDLLPPFVSEKLKEVDAGFPVKLKLVVFATAPGAGRSAVLRPGQTSHAQTIRSLLLKHISSHLRHLLR